MTDAETDRILDALRHPDLYTYRQPDSIRESDRTQARGVCLLLREMMPGATIITAEATTDSLSATLASMDARGRSMPVGDSDGQQRRRD